MLNPETLKRIRQIELRTRRLVNTTFAGSYHSVFKGQGISFDTVRPYQPGDDIRDIDWNVTARANEAYIKRYAEERELTVMIVLDASASSQFGTISHQKRDLAAELGAAIALSATSNNDRVGLLVFSEIIEQFVPPRKGRNHVLLMIRDLLAAPATKPGTDIALALRSLRQFLKQRAVIFFISDFLASSSDFSREFMVISRRHDFIAVTVSDPLEMRWPDAGIITLRDAETGETVRVDSSSEAWRNSFMSQANRFAQQRDQTLKDANVDRIELAVGDDYVNSLTQFFRRREKRL